MRAEFIAPPNSAYSTFFQNSVNLQITQPVYSGGRTLAQTRQAINTVQATRAQTLAVETSVFQAVAQAYLDAVATRPWSRSTATTSRCCASSSRRHRTASGSAR